MNMDATRALKNEPILIVGAGTWGTAIAYRLAKRGYRNITVLDSNEFPSSIAAGNDVNKILEEPLSPPSPKQDDEAYVWSTIEALATEVWRTDPIYKPHYHNTGFIYAAVGDSAYEKVLHACRSRPDVYKPLNGLEEFRRTMPKGVLTGSLQGWRGFHRKIGAGWVEAQDALIDVRTASERLGVHFICGPDRGKVISLCYDGTTVTGAITANRAMYSAPTTIIASGASSISLLDFEKQLRPTAWTLAHVPLTPEEARGPYARLPVLYGVDRGFFISPPDSTVRNETPHLKICDEHPGYIHLAEDAPEPYYHPGIPLASAERMRALLKETAPQLLERPLEAPRLCWDADTPDRMFLLSRHPRHPGLVVAVGGSGHGFMCSPGVGVLVADLMEGSMDMRVERRLTWRPEMAQRRDWFDTQGRHGGEERVVNLSEIGEDEWFSPGM